MNILLVEAPTSSAANVAHLLAKASQETGSDIKWKRVRSAEVAYHLLKEPAAKYDILLLGTTVGLDDALLLAEDIRNSGSNILILQLYGPRTETGFPDTVLLNGGVDGFVPGDLGWEVLSAHLVAFMRRAGNYHAVKVTQTA